MSDKYQLLYQLASIYFLTADMTYFYLLTAKDSTNDHISR